MLNHETGQMDWDRYPIGGSPPSPSSYYINPQNMYDMSTGSVAKIVKLEHAWRRLDGRNDDGFQVAPFPG